MRRACLIPLMLACIAGAGSRAIAREGDRPELLVFAAVSLTQVLGELAATWEQDAGVRVRLSFAASSALARQIEAGGAAHVFVSADRDWMDYLAARGLLNTATRRELAGNGLVLIAPADSDVRLDLSSPSALLSALGDGRLAIADPDAVPAGRHARIALTRLGLWSAVAGRLARADNVRAALVYVARGESPLGIVYATDALIERRVRVIHGFPDHSHPPITYPAAATTNAGADAAAFLAFLSSREAAPTWKKYGFREPTR